MRTVQPTPPLTVCETIGYGMSEYCVVPTYVRPWDMECILYCVVPTYVRLWNMECTQCSVLDLHM